MKLHIFDLFHLDITRGLQKAKAPLARFLWLSIIVIVGLYGALAWQTTSPVLAANEPLVTQAELGIVDIQGGTLYAEPAGEPNGILAPGETLTAVGRTADAQWLEVITAQQRGWVRRADVVIWGVEQLPISATAVSSPTIPGPAAMSALSATMALTATSTVTPTQPLSTPVSAGEPLSTTVITSTSVAAPTATLATAAEQSRPLTDGRPSVQVVASVAQLNIRSGPGMRYGVVGRAQRGEYLVVLGRTANSAWVQVEAASASGGSGWVASRYVQSNTALQALPIIRSTAPTTTISVTTSTTPATNRPQTVARPTGLSGRLVIQSSWGGLFHLYDLATGELRALTGGIDPAISPDGQTIAFTRIGGDDNGIYLIDSSGANERKIFGERDGLMAPKWSPDGSALVFSYNSGFY